MVKNSEPEPEPFAIEAEAWESALAPFSTEPLAAYDLARRLMEIKRFLKSKPPNVSRQYWR